MSFGKRLYYRAKAEEKTYDDKSTASPVRASFQRLGQQQDNLLPVPTHRWQSSRHRFQPSGRRSAIPIDIDSTKAASCPTLSGGAYLTFLSVDNPPKALNMKTVHLAIRRLAQCGETISHQVPGDRDDIYTATAKDGKNGTHQGSLNAIDLKDAEVKVKAMFTYPVNVSVSGAENWEEISDEYDIDLPEETLNDNELQLERINVYYNEKSPRK